MMIIIVQYNLSTGHTETVCVMTARVANTRRHAMRLMTRLAFLDTSSDHVYYVA